jgi:hypothetical protein
MISANPFNKRAAQIVYGIGVALGIVLFGISTWADLEATNYGFDRYGYQASNIRCPVLMTTSEKAVVSGRLKNTTDRSLKAVFRIDVSSLGLWRTLNEKITIEPGETKGPSWEVTPEDRVMNYFVFAKVYSFGTYPIPATEGSCGIFVLNIPGVNGGLIYWAVFLACVLGMGGGLYALRSEVDSAARMQAGMGQARRFLALTVFAGLLSSYFGWWVLGIVLLVVAVITLIAMLILAVNQ